MQEPRKTTLGPRDINRETEDCHQAFYRIIDADSGIPLEIVYDANKIQEAVDAYLPHRRVKVDGYEPYSYEDALAGKITFMAHIGEGTPEHKA